MKDHDHKERHGRGDASWTSFLDLAVINDPLMCLKCFMWRERHVNDAVVPDGLSLELLFWTTQKSLALI